MLGDVPVIVLAGGLGTRLRAKVPDLPKVLAPVEHKAFIDILLNWLSGQGVKKVIFSLGYKADLVIAHLQQHQPKSSLTIEYVVESELLGTLGALSHVFKQCSINKALVINGDTWVDVNLHEFISKVHKTDVALVRHYVDDISRYGALTFNEQGKVLEFKEKDTNQTSGGWINAGIYWLNNTAISTIVHAESGSLEQQFLADEHTQITSFPSNGKGFIDIGTPESFSQAPIVLKEFLL